MRDPGVPVVIALCALAAALLLGAPFLYDASFPGAHLWTFVAVSVGGLLLILGVLGALYLSWEWIRGRGTARTKAEKESRYQEQTRRIKVEQQEGRRAQKAEHDRVLRELQTEKADAMAQADHGSQAIAAGRDVNYYAGSHAPQTTPTKALSDEPTFDLACKPSPDDFVHLLLTNKSTPAEFHVDVIDVAARKTQTTPYSVKWRGFEGEDRRVVREALIDLMQVSAPFRRREYEHVVVIDPYDEGGSRIWRHAQFRLFSFSQQKGWVVRGAGQEETTGDELCFFRENLILVVRATRLDTGEEITRRVTIGFEAPTQDERTREWLETATNVRVEALTPVT